MASRTPWLSIGALIFGGLMVTLASCASDNFKKDDDLELPERGNEDPDGSKSSGDARLNPSSLDSGNDDSDVIIIRPTDGGTCGEIDGAAVFCVARGDRIETTGTITYGPGFTGALPAMGMGQAGVGYMPVSFPFTCEATGGDRAKSPPHNTAGGKICEVSFDNTNTTTVTGTAKYRIQAENDAGNGVYLLGLTSNAGTTIAEPPFYLKIGQ